MTPVQPARPVSRPVPVRPVWIPCLALTLCAAQAVSSPSTDAAAKQKQLDALRTKLTHIQADRDRELQRRDALQTRLRQDEKEIARLTAQLTGTDRQLAAAQAQLAALQNEQAQHRAQLEAQKAALARQIRAAYLEGHEPELKLLLNAEDPATVDRMLTYYDYFNRARAARIAAVRQELDALDAVNARIAQQVASLQSLHDQRAAALADLHKQEDARRAVVARLDRDIHSRGAEIARVRRDEQALQALLDDLRQAMSDIPPDLEQAHRFTALKGRLPWPVSGRLLKRFGDIRAEGHMKWDGDLIAAPSGTPVHAVSYGRVVYADWMPHFGLLVILDHGDGYLSIYAHNQTLNCQVGDWVQGGDTIATLGDTGGQDEAGLYFELRHGNEPLDPRAWLRGASPSG